MTYSNNIHKNALQGIANGIAICADSIKGTLGSRGNNVILEEKMYPYHQVTNDGATIIEHIKLSDPLEVRGHGFVKEAVERSNKTSGDGSTTTTILLDAILKEGMKTGVSGLEIKKSLDECLPIIEKSIDEQTKKITVKDVEAVATIAGENPALAKTLKEIYETIGKDGIIHLEASGTFDTTFSLTNGVRLVDTGFLSPFMVYDEKARKAGKEEKRAIYENPAILVTKRKIEKDDDVASIVNFCVKNSKPLVIFTDDMDSGIASRMVGTHRAGIAKILVIKAPTLWKNAVFEDFAKMTGATIVEDSSGINFKNLKIEHLGTCDKIMVDQEETTVIGIKDISSHIEELRGKQDQDSQWRVCYLNTKTAILKLGAQSETELTYLRLKAEDAIYSSKLALQKGIVVGGGICLLNCSKSLPNTLGGKIMKQALTYPIKQIIENAKATIDISKLTGNRGLNTNTREIEDLMKARIVDSAMIVKNAVRNSIGIASTILTSDVFISLPPQPPLQQNPMLQSPVSM